MAVDWTLPLTRPLPLKGGRRLQTLWDAAELITRRFGNVSQDAVLEHAVRLILCAAETGTEDDLRIATDQIALVLQLHQLISAMEK